MKHKLILWTAAVLITFLAGYLNSAFSEHYPVSGTIGVEGKKVSYVFDKIYSGKENYKLIVRTDVENLSGFIQWKIKNTDTWNEITMTAGDKIIYGELPDFEPLNKINYRIKILYNEKTYLLPGERPVVLKFIGNVPATIIVLYYLTLFGGLLLSTRTGLEYFHENGRTRLLTIITLIFFFLYTLAIHPVKTSFELNILNNRIPSITEIFDLQSITFLILWISGMWGAFKAKNQKKFLLIISILTLISFLIL